MCQSVARAGGLKPDEFYFVKLQPAVSWGYKEASVKGKTELGCARRQDLKAYAQQPTGVTQALSPQPALTNAGMGV